MDLVRTIVNYTLEALALLATNILPKVIEFNTILDGFVRKITSNFGKILFVFTERLIEHV